MTQIRGGGILRAWTLEAALIVPPAKVAEISPTGLIRVRGGEKPHHGTRLTKPKALNWAATRI